MNRSRLFAIAVLLGGCLLLAAADQRSQQPTVEAVVSVDLTSLSAATSG